MVLADADLRAELDRLQFETPNPNFPFDAEKQIQPCSIDLRLSEIAWRPIRAGAIDLSDSTPLGPKVTNSFRRTRLSFPGGFVLRPGRMLLARTYEKFSIPSHLMGLLVGRSSLGRLGLSVSGPAGFINPGWRGHMPLVISNLSPFPIRLQPYLGIVQLCLFQLSSAPSRIYGSENLGSKYVDDDGGPSRYWRDHTIKTLRQNPKASKASPEAIDAIERFSDQLDEPTRRRFERHIGRYDVVDDVRHFLISFCDAEGQRSIFVNALAVIVPVVAAAIAGWLPGLLGADSNAGLSVAALAFVVVALLAWQLRMQAGSAIPASELRRLVNETKPPR